MPPPAPARTRCVVGIEPRLRSMRLSERFKARDRRCCSLKQRLAVPDCRQRPSPARREVALRFGKGDVAKADSLEQPLLGNGAARSRGTGVPDPVEQLQGRLGHYRSAAAIRAVSVRTVALSASNRASSALIPLSLSSASWSRFWAAA